MNTDNTRWGIDPSLEDLASLIEEVKGYKPSEEQKDLRELILSKTN